MNVRLTCTSKRRVPKNGMLAPSTCPSSITSPVLISLTALSTACGFMWLAEPRSSPAPHFDGQRAFSGGGVQLGAWLRAAVPPTSMAPSTAPNAMRCMVSSQCFVGPDVVRLDQDALQRSLVQAPVAALRASTLQRVGTPVAGYPAQCDQRKLCGSTSTSSLI